MAPELLLINLRTTEIENDRDEKEQSQPPHSNKTSQTTICIALLSNGRERARIGSVPPHQSEPRLPGGAPTGAGPHSKTYLVAENRSRLAFFRKKIEKTFFEFFQICQKIDFSSKKRHFDAN